MVQIQSDNYKFLIILASQQGFIDKKTLDQCKDLIKTSDNKSSDIIEFLKKEYLTDKQLNRLLELYKIFLTPQENLRFAALAMAFKFVDKKTVFAELKKQKSMFKIEGKRIKSSEIFLAAGAMSKKQLDLVLLKQHRDYSTKPRQKSSRPDKQPATPEKKSPNVAPETGENQEPAKTSLPPMREIPGNGFTLLIQEDALRAYITITALEGEQPGAKAVLSFLESQGVIFGLADKEEIHTFLQSSPDSGQRFRIAQGTPMEESRDASIEYLFQDQFLTSGKKNEDGSMDFKDRGKVPQMNPGDAMAKKHQVTLGQNGVNIFGEDIPTQDAKDVDQLTGNGVSLSEDKLTVYAAEKGFPKKDLTGCVSVVQEYYIRGDVDYRTGHIEFDGDIIVSGTIKPGFKVICNTVTADAIEGGHLTCEGNVIVAKGIVGARIFSRGGLAASFVHQSDITCMGNINVTREIIDSKIHLNGAYLGENSRILSSDVTAREGIWAMNVGTTSSRQAVITSGVSTYAKQEMQRVDEQMRKTQEKFDARESDKSALGQVKTDLRGKLADAQTAHQKSMNMIKDLEGDEDHSPMKEKMVENHKKHLASIEGQINEFQEETFSIDDQVQGIQAELKLISKTIQTHVQEMLVLKKMGKQGNSRPTIEIGNRVEAGTKLCGCHSFAFVENAMTRVRVREVQSVSDQGEPSEWELVIEPQ